MTDQLSKIDERNPQETLPASGYVPYVGMSPTSAQPSNEALNLASTLRAVGRWWKIALPTGLLLASLAAGIVWLVFVPKYESTSLLMIKEANPYIAFDSGRQVQERRFVQTQLTLITRRRILSDALKGIANIPELTKKKDPVRWLADELQVRSVDNSELFEVSYQGRSPHDAQEIVNAVVSSYLNFVELQESTETRRVIELLEQEKDSRQRRVDLLRSQVKKQTEQLTGKDPFNPAGRDTLSFESPAAEIQKKWVDAEVQLQVLRAQLTANQEKPLSAFISEEQLLREVENAPEILRLRQTVEEYETKLSEYVAKTTSNPEDKPTYRRYAREIDQRNKTLAERRAELLAEYRELSATNAEATRTATLKTLKDAIDRGQVLTAELRKRLEAEVSKAKTTGGDSLDLEFKRMELEREEKVFDLISDRTIALKTELAAPGRIKLLDEANVPVVPVRRAPWEQLLIVTLLGLGAPFALAVLWERTAKRVADSSALLSSELNVVAEVAALPAKPRGESYFSSVKSRRELSLFEESIDSLRTGLRLSRQLKDMQVLAVASAVSREGKTSLASQLAVSIARSSGESTLLIDADMRAPNIFQIFDISNDNGLSNVLAKECELDEAIHTDYSELLHLLPAGELTASPHKLVGDESFSTIISRLRQRYRYIIIDTPPILAAGESLVLSVAADATLVCAMRNHSRAEQVREAYRRLENAQANPVGVVLNGVPVHKYSYSYGKYGYGYGYGGYGYGRYGYRR